ncbi:MAG: hypothetical protein GY953_27180 [bacterium]|nr:hypothetical protein [bacterium]
MYITRRDMAAALMGTAAAPALAQPAEADPLEHAREQVRKAIQTIEKVELEMAAEPAFIFKP